MNILVIGAGAIGSLVGAKLAGAGHHVTLVGRPRFAAAVAERGLELRDGTGTRLMTGLAPATSIQEACSSAESYAFAVMAVKSYDTASVAEELANATRDGRHPTVVTLQNGVGNEERISDVLGASKVIAGVIATPVSTLGPACIQVEKPDYSVGLSAWHPAVPSAVLNAAQSAFEDAGFSVAAYPDARSLKWTKLLMNMVGNASCAILDIPPSQIFGDKLLANLEIEAWREALSAMKAAHISPVNFGSYPVSLLAPVIRTAPMPILRRALRKSVGGARGGKMPSLYIDLESGRTKSEVNWLNGAAVRKGNENGISTPVNRMLTDLLLRLVDVPSERKLWRHNPERLIAASAEYKAAEAGRTM